MIKPLQKINWDALGITASVLCAIHCAFLPLVLASLPVLGIDIIQNAAFEYGMIGLAFAIGTWALRHGWCRHHRRLAPWILFCGGIGFLLAKQIWPPYEFRLLPFAVLLIISAHILNFRLCRSGGASGTQPQGRPAPAPLGRNYQDQPRPGESPASDPNSGPRRGFSRF